MNTSSDDQLRITSAQREHAIELVRLAAADGRLDFDELQSRAALGLEARTQGELRRIVGDLVPSAELAAFLADVTPPLQGPGSTWDDPLMIGKEPGSTTVAGVWNVPPFIEVHCTFWQLVKLNFLQARPLAPVIDVVLVAHKGSPTFIVPQGWGVDTERVSISNQGTFSSNVATRPDKGFPRLVLRGHSSNGKARYASAREVRKAEQAALRAAQARPALPQRG